MKSRRVFLFLGAVLFVLIAGLGIVFYANKNDTNGEVANNSSKNEGDVAGVSTQDSAQDAKWVEGLAKDLSEKGMVMYGAYWCSHCKNQKNLFGDAVQYIDYVECDPAGENSNSDECKANNVEGYPTWIYQGKQYSGEQSLEKLAEIIGYNQ